MRALVLAGSVLASLPALACYNGMADEDVRLPKEELLARSAVKKLYKDDFKGAAKEAAEVLAAPAASVEIKRQARHTLGIAQLRLGDLLGARSTLLESLKSPDDPAETQLIARLGEAEVGLGKFTEAKARLEELKKQGMLPDSAAHVALAKAYLAFGELDAAKAEVEAALKRDPSDAAAAALKAQLEKRPAAKKVPENRS